MGAEARDTLLGRVLAWARTRPDIDAVLLTGSRARDDGAVDACSDHDVELYTDDPSRYDGPSAWLEAIGRVWVALPLAHAAGGVTRLVFFERGEKVDFQILPLAVLERLAAEGLDDLHQRGYRVLLDRSGRAARLPPSLATPPQREPPTEAEFLATCTEFWFEAAHIPRCLARGELWVAKHRDWTMKQRLLDVLEWHAAAEGHDVWHLGTRMRRWSSDANWGRLQDAFGRFDPEDAFAALQATADLFADVSRAVARTHGFRHPEEMEAAIRAYVAVLPDLGAGDVGRGDAVR
jgi:aminoglycoside 6-adenylyltransferase